MRSIAALEQCPEWRRNSIKERVRQTKIWWMDGFNEEVGFESGDDKTKSTYDIMKGK